MEYRNLGRTGLKVSALCLGTGFFRTMTAEDTAREVMQAALDSGINFFDTADSYAGGESERFIGRFLKDTGQRDQVIISSKAYYPVGDFRQMNMMDLDFENDYFDGIWSCGSIYHIPKSDVGKVINEFRRILKKGGILGINFKLGGGEGLEENPKSYGGSPRYFAYYSKQEMTDILAVFGFKELDARLYPEEVFGDDILQIWLRLNNKQA